MYLQLVSAHPCCISIDLLILVTGSPTSDSHICNEDPSSLFERGYHSLSERLQTLFRGTWGPFQQRRSHSR